jgi:hypothetical protein
MSFRGEESSWFGGNVTPTTTTTADSDSRRSGSLCLDCVCFLHSQTGRLIVMFI